ncbi:MDR family MFS transporter [Lacticaseibacillus pantheris]|uniref:Mfs superfamily transporter n=1 Tax=Lacticaseibacillus pantheris DSM 15945 = JCM 12539 = NBRC 106106 TaxID=1423783 RepID=A0A0R1U2U0_9LACO|nr:MFS transporter [Lacticaseibacillus pantheris]KRL87631.1 mfs superfamily transporter [Lacticaseibacillus pantheris DSM 15945 = JCM 12539 = NBRC 106106]WKF85338.1 MFS transporter [Lacticaseibacillus pantheris]
MSTQRELKLKWLFLGYLITNTGASFIWPLTTIYMHQYLGETLTTAGIVLFFNSMAQVVGNIIGGRLFDKWREDRTMLIGVILVSTATGLLVPFHGWPAYPIFLVISGFGSGIVMTAINGFATRIQNRPASYVFNVLYFTSNLGLVFGTLAVGFVLPLGITIVFALAFAMYLLLFAIWLGEYRGRSQVRHAVPGDAPKSRVHFAMPVITVLITLIIVWVFYEQWNSNISAYMLGMGLKVRDYSFLWTINAVIIVTFQPVLTFFDDWLSKHLNGRIYSGIALLAVSFPLLIVAHHYSIFIASMAILTLGEITALPAISTYVDRFAPESQKGRYQGFVQGCAASGRALGPLVGALIIDGSSYRILFMAATIIIVLVAGVHAFINRTWTRSHTVDE